MPRKTRKKPVATQGQNRRKAVIAKAASADAPQPTDRLSDPLDHVPQRLLFALERIDADGMRYTAVRRAIIQKFGVSDSTAETDIKRAYDVIAQAAAAEAPQLAARVTAKLWDVAMKAEAAADSTVGLPGGGNYGPCIAALSQLAKISGAHAPKKIEVTTPGANLRTTDQRARIQELLAKARANAAKAKAGEPEPPALDA